MQIRIETYVDQAALKKFLEERQLRVPTFFDQNGNLVITINRRSRPAALELIAWLTASW